MANSRDIDVANTYDERMKQRPIGETYAVDEIYIQYEDDMARIGQQKKDTLGVLKFYRKTDLIPTNRRLIPTNKDLRLLIEMLGLDDL
jgi:hypothetical protein